MPTLHTKHYALIGGLLIAIGLQLSGVQHGWRDVASPGFIGGLIVQIGTTLAAIFTGAPQKPWNGDERRGGEP